MRILLFCLLLVSLLFAQLDGVYSPVQDLIKLTQDFFFALHALLILPGIVFSAIGVAIYFLKVKGNDNPGLWKWGMIIIGGLGVLSLVGSILALIIFALAPFLIEQLMTGG